LEGVVPSRKTPENRPEPNLAAAAEKASLVIRGLQARLHPRPQEPADESPEDLERQLAQYFGKASPPIQQPLLNDLRNRVIDGVTERILGHWERNSPIEGAVIERLIERLLDRFGEPSL
jgi:hypothetical protein